MRLSSLQKYILLVGLDKASQKFPRDTLTHYYTKQIIKVRSHQQVKNITRSLERLIDKELLTGYGVRTPHKWFIKEIKLTRKGRKAALNLLGQQQSLPFKLKIKKSKSKSTS